MTTPIPHRVVMFEQGLPGFERFQRFVLVGSPAIEPFTLLQGSGADAPTFVSIDPQLVDASYQTPLAEPDLHRLGARSGDPLLWLVLVAPRADGTATVNLRAPVVINPASMQGIQVLVAESPYRHDHPLSQQ